MLRGDIGSCVWAWSQRVPAAPVAADEEVLGIWQMGSPGSGPREAPLAADASRWRSPAGAGVVVTAFQSQLESEAAATATTAAAP